MRSKLILIVAIVLGLVTTVLFFNYMKRYDEISTANETLVQAVVAKKAIKRNETVSADALQLAQVPKKGLHPEAVKTIAEAQGKIANADIAPGEVLLSHHLQSKKEEALLVSRKVRDGYRAVSVGVNLVRSVSNLIEPEDEVDVIATPEKVTGQPVVSTLILEKARVLAIGRRMVEATEGTPYVEYATVTLEVKPADAVAIVNAQERGSISLTLYSRLVPPDAAAAPGAGAADAAKGAK
ncbi:Flp pilus assembly protein CpaB [Gordoniibacillus kamchatkensis]|uniref:Flp pilus assembly protein CpaB n=1 Tax=Gordoniibacillus kamchatkensis TaxID=1590651 RepID=UPI0009E652D9|nr:Flp pilus assembly protein CpaB [Paenibacillus sp. VKM B-2647]